MATIGSNELSRGNEVRTLPPSFKSNLKNEPSLFSGLGPISSIIHGGIHFIGQHFGKRKNLDSKQNLKNKDYDKNDQIDTNEEGPFQDTLLLSESYVMQTFPSSSTSSLKSQRGLGHEFSSISSSNPTWCDICGDLVWEPLSHSSLKSRNRAERCSLCHLTCHGDCRKELRLNCPCLEEKSDENDEENDEKEEDEEEESGSSEEVFYDAEQNSTLSGISSRILDNNEDDEDSTLKAFETLNHPGLLKSALNNDKNELLVLIQKYNEHFDESQQTKLGDECWHCEGFIKVQMNLRRPINVLKGTKPPLVMSVLNNDSFRGEFSRKSNFSALYLDSSTVQILSLDTNTCCGQVIRCLLRKFRIVDSPHKYVLYEKICNDSEDNLVEKKKDSLLSGRVQMKKLHDHDRPLEKALLWLREDNFEQRNFVLQENDPGEMICWESFSVPELNNFLRILDREEAAYKKAIHDKYERIQTHLQRLLDQKQPDISSKL